MPGRNSSPFQRDAELVPSGSRSTMFGSLLFAIGMQTHPVDLDWSAPPQCPSQAQVLTRIEGYLQDAPPGNSVRVEALVTAVEGGWELSVATVDRDGVRQQRVVKDEDCEGLVEVVAVLTALAVSPEAEEPESRPEELAPRPVPESEEPEQPKPEPPPPESQEPKPQEPESRRQPKPERPRPRVGIRVAGGAGLGWMPIGGELGLAATLSRGWWAAELEAQLGLPRQVRVSQGTAGADLLGWTIAGRGCGVVPVAPWLALPLCAGLEGGRVRATPVGLENETPAAPVWMAALVSPLLRFAVHRRVRLWLMPELQLGLVRPELHAENREVDVFAPGVVSGRVRAGLEIVF